MRFQPSPDSKADYGECAELQKRLLTAVATLERLAPEVALARHVVSYDSDRRKRCLAVVAAPLLAAGSSSAAAETEARASELYTASMKQLGAEYVSAEKAVTEWEATRIKIDVLRSLLAMQRDSMKNL